MDRISDNTFKLDDPPSVIRKETDDRPRSELVPLVPKQRTLTRQNRQSGQFLPEAPRGPHFKSVQISDPGVQQTPIGASRQSNSAESLTLTEVNLMFEIPIKTQSFRIETAVIEAAEEQEASR